MNKLDLQMRSWNRTRPYAGDLLYCSTIEKKVWEFPEVQWLGLRALTAEGTGSIPGQGTKIPHATQRNQK